MAERAAQFQRFSARSRSRRLYQYGLERVPRGRDQGCTGSPFTSNRGTAFLKNELRRGKQGCRVVGGSDITSAIVINWTRHQRIMTKAKSLEEIEEGKRLQGLHGAQATFKPFERCTTVIKAVMQYANCSVSSFFVVQIPSTIFLHLMHDRCQLTLPSWQRLALKARSRSRSTYPCD